MPVRTREISSNTSYALLREKWGSDFVVHMSVGAIVENKLQSKGNSNTHLFIKNIFIDSPHLSQPKPSGKHDSMSCCITHSTDNFMSSTKIDEIWFQDFSFLWNAKRNSAFSENSEWS